MIGTSSILYRVARKENVFFFQLRARQPGRQTSTPLCHVHLELLSEYVWVTTLRVAGQDRNKNCTRNNLLCNFKPEGKVRSSAGGCALIFYSLQCCVAWGNVVQALARTAMLHHGGDATV